MCVYCDGYNDIDSIGCQINAVLPSDLKLYSDAACTTPQVQERRNGLSNVDKEGYTFDSVYWNEETRVLSSALLNLVYPVGTIYTSTVSTSPATLFGGTWSQITNRFLYATAGPSKQTGGEETHTLTLDEIPAHTHTGQAMIDAVFTFDYQNVPASSGQTGGYKAVKAVQSDGADISVASNGGGQSHNNMPPYMTVYAWERTA